MTPRSSYRRGARQALLGAALAAIGITAIASTATADTTLDHWGFTPIGTNALPCSSTGDPAMASPMSLVKLMSAGDPATLVGPNTATTVGRENDMDALSADGKYLFASSENGAPSDGITRYTLTGPTAGAKEILTTGPVAPATTWSRMDGGYWYSPSGQLLVGEEYGPATATANTQARGGGVWQVDPTTGAYTRLDWLGSMAHEGLVYSGGALFFGDENRTGAIYKAIPSNAADLTAGGTLYFMVGTGIDASGWKAVVTPDNAVAEANNGGAILFDRPEDVDARGGRIYFTVTEAQGDADLRIGNYGTFTGTGAAFNQVVNRGGIYSFNDTGVADLSTQSGTNPPYVKIAPMIEVQDPEFATQAAAQAQQGLQYPDNIAFDGRGHLWVHEDIPDDTAVTPTNIHSKQYRNQQDEMYVFELAAGGATIVNAGTVSGGVKAGDMQSSDGTKPCTNEFTGGVFGADGLSLFFNQQHNANPTFRTALSAVLPADVPEVSMPFLLALSAGAILLGSVLWSRRVARAKA